MIDTELAAIHAYEEQHATCDIQQHPWPSVFGAGFGAGAAQVAAERDAALREVERYRAAVASSLEDFDRRDELSAVETLRAALEESPT